MNKRFSIRIKTISFFFLFFFSCVALVAQTTTFYDFNTSGQLATYFNGYGPQLGSISEQTTGGVSNSGSLSIPLAVTNAVFSTKDSYSISAVGSTYRFESVIRSQGGNGYSGLGFTTTSPTSSISTTYPASGGNTYRPASGIGVSVAGSAFIFHNGSNDYLGYWNPNLSGVSYNSSITYVKTSSCMGLINSTNTTTNFTCASPEGWYKLVLIVEKTGTSTFNMRLEVWRSNAEGVLLDNEAGSIMELNGVTNTAIASAPSIYSYFNFSGIRFTRFDNYSISLSGGATVVTAGNPVVLTTAATQNTNATSFALSGNVTAANGSVSERGFVYATSSNPTIANNKLTSGTGTGTFTVNTPSLPPGTYYFRSFATNASGTSYGEEFVRATDLSVLGGITIVSSGGDLEGTKWLYSNNTIYPTSNLAVNLNVSDVLAKMALGNLTISGSSVAVNANVTHSTNTNHLTLQTTGNVTTANSVRIETNGPLTVQANNINLGIGSEIFTTSAVGHINLYADNGFGTLANSETTRGKIMASGGGSIHINADYDNNNSGELNIDWLTIDGGMGNILLEATVFSWNTSSQNALPEFYSNGGTLTIRNVTNSNYDISTNWFALFGTYQGLTLGREGSNNAVAFEPCTSCHSSALNYGTTAFQIAGPITAFGGTINVNYNLYASAVGSDILLKATKSIVVGENVSVQTNNGDITFWSNADGVGNPDGDFIGLYSGVSINSANGSTTQTSGGGTITMAGGSTSQVLASGTVVPTGYAYSSKTTNWVDPVLPPGGVNFGEKRSSEGGLNTLNIYSGGGDIVVKGKSNSSSAGVQWFSGSTGATQVINSGDGTISVDGLATSTNAHGIEFMSYASVVHPTIISSNTSSAAISIKGETLSTIDRSGYQGTVKLEANSIGGGITVNGKTASSSNYGAIEAGGLYAYALSGPINFIGEGGLGLKIGGTWGKGNLPSSSSNITLRSDKFSIYPATTETTGTITVEPLGDTFTNAVTFPITNLTIPSTVSGLTIGKSTNTANVTFGSATSIAGPITVYGGTITVNASLVTTNSSNAPILLQGNKVFQNQGVLVQTNGSNITYNVTNSPWTAESDQGISLGTANGTIATINAQGGDISLASSFASTGVTNTSTNPDVAILLRNSKIKTSGSGTVTLNGNAYDNASTNGDFIWGLMLHTNEVIQTEHGAISITGTGGKANGNARGIIADNTVLKVLSVSGPITFTEVMPNGHSVANHSGTYFKPSVTESIKIGADGTLVTNSTSNVVFDVARITFDGTIAPTVVNTSGTVTIQPVGNQFEAAVSLAGLSLSNTVTGLTVGKSTNTANITFANATSIAGPITAYGSNIAINGALTATNSSISLQASGTVTQTAAITATNLELSGTGNYTLNNTSNNVGTIAGGTSSSKLGSLSYTDSNVLTIGAITNPGIVATGKINIQTITNNLNLNSSVATDNTASDAIILNAGKSTAIGTSTGGDIIVSGTPTVTTGTNGIARLFSGSNANSTGLTSLVGGDGNTRTNYDETSATFSPVLVNGNNYALYRFRDLTCEDILAITVQPTVVASEVCKDASSETISFTSTASDYSIQWYSNSSNSYSGATLISGAISNSLSLPTNIVGTKYYFARLTSNLGFCFVTTDIVSQTVLQNLSSISSISGLASIASNVTTATYSIASVTNATSYVWNLPPGMSITSSAGNSIQVSVSSTFVGGNVTVKAINTCSESSVRSLAVSRQNIPLAITGVSTICIAEGSVTESYSVPTVAGATSYVWTVPSGSVITSGTNTNTISLTYNASFTRGTIRVSASGSQGVISSGTLTVSGIAMPVAIVGATQICTAGTYEYSITAVDGATSYGWILPVGMTLQGAATGTSIVVSTSSSVSGTISVRALSPCGSSQPRTLSISGVSTPGYIYGERIICGATSNAVDINGNVTTTPQTGIYTYSILPVTGADSYTWTLPTGVTLVSGQGTRNIQVSFASVFVSGSITVVANSLSCGTSPSRAVAVSAANASIGGPSNVCGLTTATYSVSAGVGSNYVWSLPQGMSIQSGEGTNSITVSIQNPINFTNNNQVSLSFTTPCGGTKVVNMTVDCPDYSNLTNCGSTVAFNERVYTRSISGATMYAFDIYESTTDALLNTYETQGNFFQFVQALPSFEFGTTYNVKVRVKKNGVYGTAGSSCSISITAPVTAIQTSQCGQTVTIEDRVYATSVWNGVTYAFDIYDNEGSFITTIEKTSNFFRMSEFASVYGMTYQIGVRVKRGNGSYGEQGSRCNITIAIPTTSLVSSQCNATINVADRIYARSVANATMYAFRIYDVNGIFVTELERPYNFFRITDISYSAGATYQVGVKVKQGEGNYGLEGTLCSIITAKDEIKREVKDQGITPMTFTAYPNPFTASFTITPLEGETATMFYQVYDVTGKMLESKSVEASEITNHTIGDDYPVGMYLVIARQGATSETFKMIKQ